VEHTGGDGMFGPLDLATALFVVAVVALYLHQK
jgi:hypothetical protein